MVINFNGEITLVQIRDLQVPILFWIVQSLAMNVLLRKTNIDKQIQRIFPKEPKIVPEHSAPFAILGASTVTGVKLIMSHKAPIDMRYEQATIWNAKGITIPVETESLVVVETYICDLMTIDPIQIAKLTQLLFSAQCIYEVYTTSNSDYL